MPIEVALSFSAALCLSLNRMSRDPSSGPLILLQFSDIDLRPAKWLGWRSELAQRLRYRCVERNLVGWREHVPFAPGSPRQESAVNRTLDVEGSIPIRNVNGRKDAGRNGTAGQYPAKSLDRILGNARFDKDCFALLAQQQIHIAAADPSVAAVSAGTQECHRESTTNAGRNMPTCAHTCQYNLFGLYPKCDL